MDVSEIISNVARISTNDDSPDSEATARLLSYLNMVYKLVYRKIAPYYKTRLATTQSVSVTAGSGTLSTLPLRIHSVTDTTNENRLIAADFEEIELNDPELDDTGNPTHFYIENDTTIVTYPKDTVTLRVRYTPEPADLTSGTLEADIKIPAAYHDILVHGTLFLSHMDENDLRAIGELQVSDSVFGRQLNELIAYLKNRPGTKTRTSYQDF